MRRWILPADGYKVCKFFACSLCIWRLKRFIDLFGQAFRKNAYIRLSTRGKFFGKKFLLFAIVIASIGFFHLSTIRGGQDWGDDFSLYIHHAKNLAEGKPYQETGYLYNPFDPGLSPKAYPPVFPLLLAPVYLLAGMNLTAMKVVVILFFLFFLTLMTFIFQELLPFHFLLILTVIMGFNPYFWEFKDRILSDIPFLFFLYFSIFLAHLSYRKLPYNQTNFNQAFSIAFLLLLSVGTRNIGLVLLPCFIFYDLLLNKRISLLSIYIFSCFLILFLALNYLIPATTNYIQQYSFNTKKIWANFWIYAAALASFWHNGYYKALGIFLFLIITALSVYGYILRIKENVTLFEIFPLIYLPVIILWPYAQGIRFLIPVIPLYLVYFIFGLRSVLASLPKAVGSGFCILVITAILATYGARYSTMDFGPIKEGITKKESQELFRYVREHTRKDAVLIFFKPRALALFTGRMSSSYHKPPQMDELLAYMLNINASYIIISSQDRDYLFRFIKTFPNQFQLEFANSDFCLYRINANQK